MRTFLAFLLFLPSLFAQAPDVARGPIAFASATSDSAIWVAAGGPNGAVTWRLTYHVDGTLFTAAQVGIQGANAATSAGCATAAWNTITTANADVVESVNPSVSAAQGNVAVKSFYPCIRMIVTAVTGAGGTVTASIAGYKGGFIFPSNVTVTPSGTQDVNVTKIAGTAVPSDGIAGTMPIGGVVNQNGNVASDTYPVLIAGSDYASPQKVFIPKIDSSGRAVVEGDAAVGAVPSGNPVPMGGSDYGSPAKVYIPKVDSLGNLFVTGGAAVGSSPSSNPVLQGLLDSAGKVIIPDYCTLKAVIPSPATGNTLLVGLSGTTTIRICKWSFTTDTMTTAQLVTGQTITTACDTGPSNETAVYSGAGGGLFGVIEDYQSPLITTAGKNLCIKLSAGVTTSGGVTIEYSQR